MKERSPDLPVIHDEPGMAERFQRGLQRALNTPPQPRTKSKPVTKAKRRSAKKECAKTRS